MHVLGVVCLLIVHVISGSTANKLGNCTKYGSYGYNRTNHITDTNIGVGDAVSIHCTLDQFNNYSAEQLRWIVNGTIMAPPLVTVIGDKTLSLNLAELSLRGTGTYRCNVETQKGLKIIGMCIAKVNVGMPPMKVNNFSCLSHNWEYMECTWSTPYNAIKTNYTLRHYIHNKIISVPCAITPLGYGQRMCNMTKSDQPMYYDMYKKNFTFVMDGGNVLGRQSWEFFLNHLSRVKPKPPSNLMFSDVTSRTAKVTWSLPYGLPKEFGYYLLYKIRYRSNYDTMERTLLENRTTVQLTGLIPYASYDFSVSCITVAADQNDDILWSSASTINFTTLPHVPAAPPEVTNGSFHLSCLLNSCSATIYWKAVPRFQWQGTNFTYDVVAELLEPNGERTILVASDVTSGSALVENLVTSKDYKFVLHSKNDNGLSTEQSELVLTPKQMMKRPSSIVVTGFSETLYEVTWTPPPASYEASSITGYKVFAFSSHTPFIKSPEGSMMWETVDQDTMSRNVSVSGRGPFYSFGVVTLGENGRYSDIEWNTCIVYYNGTIGKMKKVSIDSSGPTSITVKWLIDCAEKKGIITGYNVHYCRTAQENSNECIGHSKNNTVIGTNTDHYIIPDLKPNSCYQVSVSVVTRAGIGEFSDPKFSWTNEDAPTDPPSMVEVFDITNSSFKLSWTAPLLPNGCITKYHVRYMSSRSGECFQVVNVSECGVNDSLTYSVNVTADVYPYSNYIVTVEACTGLADCSPKSKPIEAFTHIGVPDKMGPPKIRWRNDTHLIVEPNMPGELNGPLLVWDIQVVETVNSNRTETRSMLRGIRSDMIFMLPCEEDERSHNRSQARTRAVNVPANGGLPLEGPWSEYADVLCSPLGFSPLLIFGYIILAGVVMAVICLVAFYVFREGKSYWIKISTIKVVLPQGIEAENNEKFENGLRQFDSGLRQQKKDNTYSRLDLICDSVPTAKLLNDDVRFRNASGDTTRSNCSTDGLLPGRNWANDSMASGTQDSTSSRPSTATTNVSTDSSMELASSIPESPDSVFSEHPLKNAVALTTTTTAVPTSANMGTSAAATAAAAALFSPSLGPIGESPQHYSKFAGYYKDNHCDHDDATAEPTGGVSNGYVAAPYSKFALGHTDDDVDETQWRHSAPGDYDNSPVAASYSKFGAGGGDALFPGPLTFGKVDPALHHRAPATSTPTRLSPGYSVFGVSDDTGPVPDDDDGPGASKGYVLAATFNGAALPATTAPAMSLGVADTEVDAKRVGRLSPTVYDEDELDGHHHKRSPSNASSSLTAGYCRMALSRPTSVGSDSGGQYVSSDPASQSDYPGSPSKVSDAGGGSGSGGLRSPSAELPASVYQNAFGEAIADDGPGLVAADSDAGAGYATMQQILGLDGNS